MESDFQPAKRSAKSLQKQTFSATKTAVDDDKPFKTPDEVAAEQTLESKSETDMGSTTNASDAPNHRFALHWPPGKIEWLIIVLLIVGLGGGIAYGLTGSSPKPVAKTVIVKPKPKAPPKPTTVPSTLSGLQVDPTINARTVTGVMIENSTEARPQAGLSQASVVFEAIAEGGITRFLALYQDTAPDNVGPIRSVRPYYEQWTLGFDASLAHVGGSPEALADMRAWNVKDLDQFHNGGSYHRTSDRAAPHNVYTSIAALNQLETSKGYTTSTFTGFVRKDKENPAKVPSVKSIDMSVSGPTYQVHYNYNSTTNSYDRVLAGAPHVDANTAQQISPKVVIAMVIPYSLEADGYHSDYAVIGGGPVYIFQDGVISTGQWAKVAATSQITFADAAGKPIPLNPGQTWLTTLANTTKISYAP